MTTRMRRPRVTWGTWASRDRLEAVLVVHAGPRTVFVATEHARSLADALHDAADELDNLNGNTP